MFKKLILRVTPLFCCTVILLPCVTFAEDTFRDKMGRFFSDIEVLPEYYFELDVPWFMNQKNNEMKEKYLVGAYSYFEGMVLSWREQVFMGAFYINNLGMGKQYEDIVFDPRDVGYALSPFFEVRFDNLNLRFGLDHRCHHQVDRKTRPSIYWNKPFVSVGSVNRPGNFYGYSHEPDLTGFFDRLSWEVSLGYYLTRFGNTRPAILFGGNNLKTGSHIKVRYAVYKNNSLLVTTGHKTHLDTDHDGDFFWSQRFDIEASVHRFRNGFSIYLDYVNEFPNDRPFHSKDQLVAFGTKFFF